MSNVTHYPSLIFALTFSALWLTAWAGVWLGKKGRELEADLRDDFGLILAATLTLLALIIGFSFSMATARYDQRKNYEEQEANAIGTEYVRADLLSPVEAAKVRSLLGSYLDQRVLFYTIHDEQELLQISARTVQLQAEFPTQRRTRDIGRVGLSLMRLVASHCRRVTLRLQLFVSR